MAQSIKKDPLAEIAAILAKAENNPNAEEAQMAMDRATTLSERYGIDLAMARMHQDSQVRVKPIKERIKIGDPLKQGNDHLMRLFATIALLNDCRVTISGETVKKDGHWRYSSELADERDYLRDLGYSDEEIVKEIGEPDVWVSGQQFRPSIYATVYGYEVDIEVVKRIYAVAVTQMVAQANRAISRKEHGSTNAKTWRANFYQGFDSALHRRLKDAKKAAIKEATEEYGGGSTALVLADKSAQVDALYKEENPHFFLSTGEPRKGTSWKGPSTSNTNWSGLSAGAKAARNLNLHDGSRELSGGSRAIGS